MIRLRTRLRRLSAAESGMGLVEVLIAMMIFSIAALGIAYAALASVQLTDDSVNRETAGRLAAQTVDQIRAVKDPFKVDSLVPASQTYTIGNTTYTATFSSAYVTTGNSSGCSAGAGLFLYRSFHVTVDWTGRLSSTQPVTSDTALSPVNRVNNPSYGTLYASVNGTAGTGISGVTVTATPTSLGAPVTMPATDSSGCSYAFGVTPGTYTISVSAPGYVSSLQKTSPAVASLTVAGGGAITASFAYDRAATYNLTYSYTTAPGSTVLGATDMDLTFSDSDGDFNMLNAGMVGSQGLYPKASGYTGLAGPYQSTQSANPCLSPDPASWPANSTEQAGSRLPAVAAAPGGSVAMTIPMGSITASLTKNVTYYAVSTTPSGDAPSCAAGMNYAFTPTSTGTFTLPLPWGTWQLHKSSLSGPVLTGSALVSQQSPNGSLTATTGTVVLDPRSSL